MTGHSGNGKNLSANSTAHGKLFTRDFILLFCMAMCSNSYLAVFYCFEQWLEGLQIGPNWRGILLSALYAMVLLWRPVVSVFLLSRSKLIPLVGGICVSSCVMLSYSQVSGPNSVLLILLLRLIQGISLAVYSSCVVAVLVSCIPSGQSAKGFAIFSLASLLPYSIIPALGEHLLPLLKGEANLFALVAVLAIPALCMVFFLAPKLRKPEISVTGGAGSKFRFGDAVHAMTHSGLGCIYLSCLSFSIMTILVIYFMKGLCLVTGAMPARFFMTYTITMILIRLVSGHMLDTLPRYRVVPLCALALTCSVLILAWGPLWSFVPSAIVYGLGLGFLYPLLASTIYDRSSDETRSINSNVMMLTFDASGMLGPLLGGAVISGGFGYRGVFVTAAIMVLCCGGFMVLDRLRLAWWDRKQAARNRSAQ